MLRFPNHWLDSTLFPFLKTSVYGNSKRLTHLVQWLGVKGAITNYCASGHTCQCNKYKGVSPASFLLPLPIPKAICKDLSLDFIKVVEVQRYDTILVVDWLFTGLVLLFHCIKMLLFGKSCGIYFYVRIS